MNTIVHNVDKASSTKYIFLQNILETLNIIFLLCSHSSKLILVLSAEYSTHLVSILYSIIVLNLLYSAIVSDVSFFRF